jgi:hypothetical protein
MGKLLLGLIAGPLLAGAAFAGEPLNDRQMDQVTAGDAPTFTCPPNCGGTSVSTSGPLNFQISPPQGVDFTQNHNLKAFLDSVLLSYQAVLVANNFPGN